MHVAEFILEAFSQEVQIEGIFAVPDASSIQPMKPKPKASQSIAQSKARTSSSSACELRNGPRKSSSQRTLKPHFFIPFDELVFHETIGRGSFKTVYRGRWGNAKVAIVRMSQGGMVTEARLMQRLSTHPNLVQFYR
jgi:hypothetical protein